ncbi:MAG: DUF1858 domain-containing protein [Acidimicrobiales bacterium]
MPRSAPITPESKVAEVLRDYPQTEGLLIGMAPAFKKLRNPALRRSVARVATLRQAAVVGKLPLATLVNELRAAAGQEPIEVLDAGSTNYLGPQPDWFEGSQVVSVLDERDLDPDVMPINPLLHEAKALRGRHVVEFVSAHVPAPGIDLRSKGPHHLDLRVGRPIPHIHRQSFAALALHDRGCPPKSCARPGTLAPRAWSARVRDLVPAGRHRRTRNARL